MIHTTTPADCAAYVAEARNWPVATVLSPGRTPKHVEARREFVRLARAYTPCSYAALADICGLRSHSSVRDSAVAGGPLTREEVKRFERWLGDRWKSRGL